MQLRLEHNLDEVIHPMCMGWSIQALLLIVDNFFSGNTTLSPFLCFDPYSQIAEDIYRILTQRCCSVNGRTHAMCEETSLPLSSFIVSCFVKLISLFHMREGVVCLEKISSVGSI
jgi:hypothetical protein